ncbi:MAG: ornithine cyclodeaminase family protein [Senegalia sp. (in: firmicutes)]|uniref:ornithine cyclodeaminase family protein n=1 Tax=Senegalia sp. (in: firmicutes) TaxID=1924098 RepID=UPI003F9B727B
MEILILKKKDIEEVYSMKDAIGASKDALELYSKGESDIPLRINLNVKKEEGQSLYMPGYVPDADALGLKLVSVYPNNTKKGLDSISSTMVLKNESTGEVSSIMDGTYLTKLRTGAVSGAATDLLARKDASIFALIGTGGQAKSQLEAILNVRPIKEVRVFARNKEKTEDFIKQMKKELGDKFDFNIIACDSSKEAIDNADIITCVTTAKEPVFDGKLVKKGAHINGVGSYTPDMQEIDPYIICNADKIYVDTLDGVINESGDFIKPIKEGKFKEDDINGELGELIMNKIPSRENEDEITLFKTVGSSILDLVTAKKIYDKAIEHNMGEIIEF